MGVAALNLCAGSCIMMHVDKEARNVVLWPVVAKRHHWSQVE